MSDLTIGRSSMGRTGRTANLSGTKTKKQPTTETAQLPAKEQNCYDTVEISERARARRAQQSYASGDVFTPLFEDAAEELEQMVTKAYHGGSNRAYENVTVPTEPVRKEDELDETWQLRQIDHAVTASWTANLKQWMKTTQTWQPEEGQRYVNEQSTKWVTDLMQNQPAQFRQWLEKSKWMIEAGHIDNCVLPSGFTLSDCRQWMQKSVLAYQDQ